MARTIARALLLILLLLPGLGAPAVAVAGPDPSAEGMIGVRLLDIPTARTEDPRARTYIVDHVAPGTTIRRRIEISNTTPTATAIAVYQGAASISQGTFTPGPGRARNELTQWTTVDESSLELPTNQTRPVGITIAVPPDAAAGEHYGVVWAEVRSDSPGAVTVVNRVGIRMYLSVGAGGEPASGMHADALTAGRDQNGRPSVTAQISNTGGRALDVVGRLTLSGGPGGLSGGPYDTEKALTLLPGQNGIIAFVLAEGLPDGPWTAHLDATSGTVKASTDSTIVFPSNPEVHATPRTVPDLTPWAPWTFLAALIALTTVLILIRMKAGRRIRASPTTRQRGQAGGST